jgi:hypothetical protein
MVPFCRGLYCGVFATGLIEPLANLIHKFKNTTSAREYAKSPARLRRCARQYYESPDSFRAGLLFCLGGITPNPHAQDFLARW